MEKNGRLIDIHCHAGGIGAGKSGCFVSHRLQRSYKFRAYLRAVGISGADLGRGGDEAAARKIAATLAKSRRVEKAVLLALDGVVDGAGNLDGAKTEVYTPNDFVAKIAGEEEGLLFGASINPLRRDAIDRLHEAAGDGAVLVKWLPNIQGIDPADERHVSFYLAMKKLRLPLLCHTGTERSFTRHSDEFGDPMKLSLPLSLGLTVIAAHCGGNGRYGGEKSILRFLGLCGQFPNLYGDLSAATQVNVPGNFSIIVAAKSLRGRLLYGTDMPLANTIAVTPLIFPFRISPAGMLRISRIENPWDRDVALKEALGLDLSALADPYAVLRLPGEKDSGNDSGQGVPKNAFNEFPSGAKSVNGAGENIPAVASLHRCEGCQS